MLEWIRLEKLSRKTKAIIAAVIIIVLLLSSICFRFTRAYQNIMADSIINLKTETDNAIENMADLLNPDSTAESRMVNFRAMSNYLAFVKVRLPRICTIYFNDAQSRLFATYFQESIDDFEGFLANNKNGIVNLSLDKSEMEVLEDYSNKLSELSLKVNEMADYTEKGNQIPLISSLIVSKTDFRSALAESVMTFYEFDEELLP
ncbi:MAG TPA: hypothetical protein GX526_07365 [Thermoanaerobacterales bacterium]|nr:hypothetical protein [Thermoanaerobacterales bacterium]